MGWTGLFLYCFGRLKVPPELLRRSAISFSLIGLLHYSNLGGFSSFLCFRIYTNLFVKVEKLEIDTLRQMSSQKVHCWTLERVPPDLATGPPFVLDNAKEKIRVGRRETTNDMVRLSLLIQFKLSVTSYF